MDNIICPDCGEETYIIRIGKIGTWEWWQCDACDKRHWRNLGGITNKQLEDIRRGQVYAAMNKQLKG
jgi:hypothetical protein